MHELDGRRGARGAREALGARALDDHRVRPQVAQELGVRRERRVRCVCAQWLQLGRSVPRARVGAIAREERERAHRGGLARDGCPVVRHPDGGAGRRAGRRGWGRHGRPRRGQPAGRLNGVDVVAALRGSSALGHSVMVGTGSALPRVDIALSSGCNADEAWRAQVDG